MDHRRTVILFNELYSPNDGLPFIKWISPDADSLSLWDHPANYEIPQDTEITALVFVHKLAAKIWQKVVDDLEDIIEECLKHIIYRVHAIFFDNTNDESLSVLLSIEIGTNRFLQTERRGSRAYCRTYLARHVEVARHTEAHSDPARIGFKHQSPIDSAGDIS